MVFFIRTCLCCSCAMARLCTGVLSENYFIILSSANKERAGVFSTRWNWYRFINLEH